ncbi:MAG: alcohol dehydrogenase catalytic domain-containing protein [Chitinophagaceae bacterium]|nr:alcohol dehydrogenase catalytic domain-containing protein [Chitinophagaceae bacterium]
MFITSKAALANGSGGFVIDETVIQEPGDDEVIVKMKAAGLCHTDYDSLKWKKSFVLGHEGAGVIYKTGRSVKGLTVGDRVILNWATPCGQCFQCKAGNEHICEKNSPVVAGNDGYTPGHAHLAGTTWKNKPVERSFNLGTFSEFALVKSSAVVKNHSSKISDEAAAIVGCGVMTGYGSVINAAKVKPGASVVVLGAGGVGLNVIQGARISGAAVIIAVDTNPGRLEMSRQFGATHIIKADRADTGLLQAAEQVKKLTHGRGADYAFECTAVPELGAAPLAMVRNAGVAVQVSGIEQEIKIDMRLFEWDKVYINPLYGQCRPQVDFPKIVSLYDAGSLLLDEMVTRKYALHDLQQAFDDMLQGKNAKGVIVFD